MILVIKLIVILYIEGCKFENTETKSAPENSCQSGLREDNTNYIYCARQGLTKVPNFFSSTIGHDSRDSRPVLNVIYDELVLSDNVIQSIEHNSFANNLKVRYGSY